MPLHLGIMQENDGGCQADVDVIDDKVTVFTDRPEEHYGIGSISIKDGILLIEVDSSVKVHVIKTQSVLI